MKHPDDVKTIELPIDKKRSRGRPALDNALSPAERARRYRANKKLNPAPMMPSNLSVITDELQLLRKELRERDREVATLKTEQNLLIEERTKAFNVAADAQASLAATKKEMLAAVKKEINVTRNDNSVGLLESRLMLANSEKMLLSENLQVAQDRIEALFDALMCCLQARASKQRLPDELATQYVALLKKTVTRNRKSQINRNRKP